MLPDLPSASIYKDSFDAILETDNTPFSTNLKKITDLLEKKEKNFIERKTIIKDQLPDSKDYELD
jgi:hypothetical protein